MSTPLAERILHFYRLQPVRLLPSQKGYRNTSLPVELPSGVVVNIMLYKTEPGILQRIQYTNRLGTELSLAGLPVRYPVHQRLVRLAGLSATRYAALYNYLPGQTIPWDAYTRHHLKAMGQALGQLHAAPVSGAGLPLIASELLPLLSRMRGYFNDPGVASALARELGLRFDPAQLVRYERLIHHTRQLPARPLHLDFVRSNLLFGPELDHPEATIKAGPIALTGIIDLEKAALGHPIFDLARTLAFLLVDCQHKSPRQIYRFFLRSGYIKRSHQPFHRGWFKLLEPLIEFYLLHDFYKFLRHNPYPSLIENAHFQRTLDLLLQKHLIESLAVNAQTVTGDKQRDRGPILEETTYTPKRLDGAARQAEGGQ